MSNPTPIVFRATCVGGFLATAMAGWHLAAPRSTSMIGDAGEKQAAAESKRSERKLGDGGIPVHVRETMAAIRGAATPEQRMRATIDLARSLPISELELWLEKRWFDSGDSFDFTLFNKIARQRWEAEDREGLIAYYLKSNSPRAREMLAKLATEDPARALALSFDKSNPGVEMATLFAVAAVDTKLALTHLKGMLERGVFDGPNNIYQASSFLQSFAQKDPAALEALLTSMPRQMREMAEGAITGQKLKADFAGALKELMERPDGFKAFEAAYSQGDDLKGGILDHLSELPESWKKQIGKSLHRVIGQENAAKWLEADLEGMGFTATDAKRVRDLALHYHAIKNPTEALKMLGSMGLSENSRRNVIGNTFRSARGNPKKMEELMAALESEEDMAIARQFVEVKEGGLVSKDPAQIKEPKEWLEAVMSRDTANRLVYLHYMERWPKEKIDASADEFRGMAAAEKSSLALLLADSNFSASGAGGAQELKGEAIRYLVENPPPKEENKGQGGADPFGFGGQADPNSAASSYAVFLAQKDPDAASQWVQTLPAGEARQWAQKNLAKNWAMYDPEAMQQWVATLPSAERKGVEDYLKARK